MHQQRSDIDVLVDQQRTTCWNVHDVVAAGWLSRPCSRIRPAQSRSRAGATSAGQHCATACFEVPEPHLSSERRRAWLLLLRRVRLPPEGPNGKPMPDDVCVNRVGAH
jgi:hypothetical protein